MATGSRYFKVAVSANTNTAVRAAGVTKTSSYRMVFVSSGTDATEVRIADSSATLTAGEYSLSVRTLLLNTKDIREGYLLDNITVK